MDVTMDAPLVIRARRDLATLVKELEEQFEGGTTFFDYLDQSLRDPYWYAALITEVAYQYGNPARRLNARMPRLAMSGRFGEGFARWFANIGGHPTPLVFPGDLRHNDLPPLVLSLRDEQFVFVDDSYFKGRTYSKVKEAIEKCGGSVVGLIVLYDGSRERKSVSSFFRYHPFEGIEQQEAAA